MDVKGFSAPPDLHKVHVTDAFWGREQDLVRREVIPYQWEALNDRVPGAAPSFCMRNFKVAGRLLRESRTKKDFVAPVYTFRGFNALPKEKEEPEADKFYGFVFQDSDFYKWIEAVGYSLATCPDPELERIADEAIDIVCAAQAKNGYLDTYYIINGMDRIFTNLKDHHELYCFGHLAEGAVAYYQATGKDKLLKAAMRYGDFIAECFGPGEGQRPGYPGHEIAEMALARLYELSGEEKYLALSRFFLDMRGQKPYYFDREERERAEYEGREFQANPDPGRYAYYQAHRPVREQDEAVGHAVRAVYLYSGMADVARLTKDQSLYEACRRLWDSIVREKLYITGGIGGTHLGEAFSYPCDLPNDTAYSETCAAIGLAFFARRMLQIEADSQYGDVMEQALYNTVLAGMALDGKSFFYVNPLEAVPEACEKDGRKAHVKPVRQKWFGCACCPPNLARIVSSLGAYIYTEREDVLFVHLYVGSSMTKKTQEGSLSLEMESAFPWEGEVRIRLHVEGDKLRHTLAFRMPGWCRGADVQAVRRKLVNPESDVESVESLAAAAVEDRELRTVCTALSPEQVESVLSGGSAEYSEVEPELAMDRGYLYLTADWQEGDEIFLHFPMEVRCLQANTAVRENVGKAAFVRGPLCYCMEEADNGKDLHLCRVDGDAVCPGTHRDQRFNREDYEEWEETGPGVAVESGYILGTEIRVLRVPGRRRPASREGEALYGEWAPPREEETSFTLIPYYAWANRGPGEMQVWTEVFFRT